MKKMVKYLLIVLAVMMFVKDRVVFGGVGAQSQHPGEPDSMPFYPGSPFEASGLPGVQKKSNAPQGFNNPSAPNVYQIRNPGSLPFYAYPTSYPSVYPSPWEPGRVMFYNPFDAELRSIVEPGRTPVVERSYNRPFAPNASVPAGQPSGSIRSPDVPRANVATQPTSVQPISPNQQRDDAGWNAASPPPFSSPSMPVDGQMGDAGWISGSPPPPFYQPEAYPIGGTGYPSQPFSPTSSPFSAYPIEGTGFPPPLYGDYPIGYLPPISSYPPVIMDSPTSIPRPPSPIMPGMRGQLVNRVQEALIQNGFHPGEIDSIYGDQTFCAVKAFQMSRGLIPTGETDMETLHALGLDVTYE